MARKRSGGGGSVALGEAGGRFVSLAILSPSSFSCHFVPVITPKMVAGLCDLLRGRGGQTGTGGVGGEEDYGMEEGTSCFPFFLLVATAMGAPPGRDGGEVEVFGVKGSVKVDAPRTSRGQIQTQARDAAASACQTKCLYCASAKKKKATKKNKHPLMVCLCWFFFPSNIVIYICLIYAAHVQEHTCAHA